MNDLFGSEQTTTAQQQSTEKRSVNNYGSSDALAGYNDIYSRVSRYIDQSSGSVYDNPTYQAGAKAIKNSSNDIWVSSANQINDLFDSSSFWSGSAHNNALVSGAQKNSSNLADALSSYWTGAQTSQNNALSSRLSQLLSLIQSNSDVTSDTNVSSCGQRSRTESGLGDAFGTVLGGLDWNKIFGI